MEELKDITLKVKLDTYKALQNYLNNELKMNKKDFEDLVEQKVESVLKKHLEEDGHGRLNGAIDRTITGLLSGYSSSRPYSSYLLERVNKAIEEQIGKVIRETVSLQLKELNLTIVSNIKDNIKPSES